jgi:hypothetical protein
MNPSLSLSETSLPIAEHGSDTMHRRTFLSRVTSQAAKAALGVGLVPALHSSVEAEEKEQRGLVFDGEDDYIVIPRLHFNGAHALSMQVRVTPSDVTREQTIIGNQHNAGVGIRLADGYWEAICHMGGQFLRARSDTKVEADRTVELLAVFDAQLIRLYVDGVLQSRGSIVSGKHKPSPYSFMIGADPDRGGLPQNLFAGNIENVRLSGIARDQLKQWKKQTSHKPESYDLLLLRLSEGEGDVVHDSSLFHHHGIVRGATWRKKDEK